MMAVNCYEKAVFSVLQALVDDMLHSICCFASVKDLNSAYFMASNCLLCEVWTAAATF